MRIHLIDRIKALFARDKFDFWWNHFTDEEKELSRMDVWELANVIQDARKTPGMEKKGIVAEHLLNVRLAQIQAKASKLSGWLSLLGAILTVIVSVIVSYYFGQSAANNTAEVTCVCNYPGDKKPSEKQIRLPESPAVQKLLQEKRTHDDK